MDACVCGVGALTLRLPDAAHNVADGTEGNPLLKHHGSKARLSLDATFAHNPWMQPQHAKSAVFTDDGTAASPDEVATSLAAFRDLLAAVASVALLTDDCTIPVATAIDAFLSKGAGAYTELGMSASGVEHAPEPTWTACGPDTVAGRLLRTWLWSVECWMGVNMDDLQLVEFAIDEGWGYVLV